MQVLFIGPSRIGDAVLSSGVLAWMLARWPDAQVTVAAGPAAAPFYAEVPRLEDIVVLEKQPLAGHWRRLWLHVAGRFWTAVADTRRSAVTWLVAARRRYVMGATRGGQHKVVQASAMVGNGLLPPQVWLGERHRREAEALIPPGGPVLALAPTANWGGKQWPADRFAALAARLTAPDGPMPSARVAVFAGPGERGGAQPVLDSVAPEQRIDLAGTVDLLTAAACLARASLFVGNDSGLMHLAAASGTPTLGLFGPSRDEHYAPFGPRALAVRTDLTYEQIIAKPDYDYRSHETHMESLSVDKAFAAALDLLARCRTAPV